MPAVNTNLLKLGQRYTRPQLAELWAYEGYQALAKGVVTPSGSGVILLFVTHIKQDALTQYNDFISGDYLYWEGEEGHRTDDRVARAHERGEVVHLFYRDIHHSPFVYRGILEVRRYVPHDDRPSEFTFRLAHDLGALDDLNVHEGELASLRPTDREAVVKARVGQGVFRDSLMRFWGGCAITSVDEAGLLRAGHIKPWRDCTNIERLDVYNGFLLLPQYDHLFDRGFLTFQNDGLAVVSPVVQRLAPEILGIDPRARLRRLEVRHLPYLEHHRENVFIAQRTED